MVRKEKIVITGHGLINSLGLNSDDVWQKYLESLKMNHSIDFSVTDKVYGYNAELHFTKKELKRLDTFTQYSLIATNEAINKAALDSLDNEDIGILIGASGNGTDKYFLENHEILLKKGPRRVSPYYSSLMVNSPPAELAIEHSFQGLSGSFVAGEASSLLSIGHSMRLIRNEKYSAMVSGGTQGDISQLTKGGYKKLGLTTAYHEDFQPLNTESNGHVLGAGAGSLILESESFALRREANILGEVLGFSMVTVIENVLDSYVNVMQSALNDAGIQPEDVSMVSVQGCGIPKLDQLEISAIEKVFRGHYLKVICQKQKTGNLIAANGVTQTILTLLTLNDELKKNVQGKDKMSIGIINTFDFNGHCACLVIRGV